MSPNRVWPFALLIACSRQRSDIKPEPAPSVAPSTSVSAVASASAQAAAPSGAIRCRTGLLVDPATGDAASDGGGGWGDGIGLGTVGGFGGATRTRSSTTSIDGRALATTGLQVEDVDRAVCAQLGAMSLCIEDARKTKPAMRGDVEVELVIDAGAVSNTNIASKTLEDAAALRCVTDGLAKVKLAAGTGKARYAMSIASRRNVAIKMIETNTEIRGKLPPEVVKRIIRANFPRFRACYEQGLKKESTLAGVVSVKFKIDSTGAVESANLDPKGSTMPDKQVQGCVLGVYRTLSFPEPDSGSVDVSYPINFQSEE